MEDKLEVSIADGDDIPPSEEEITQEPVPVEADE